MGLLAPSRDGVPNRTEKEQTKQEKMDSFDNITIDNFCSSKDTIFF